MKCTAKNEKIAEHESQLELLIRNLPKERHSDGTYLYFYQGFWCPSRAISGITAFQQHFQPQDTDLILATYPKSGTTWLKALIFAIITRTTYPLTENPLLFTSPHELVPFLEFGIYHNNPSLILKAFPSQEFSPPIRHTPRYPPPSLIPSVELFTSVETRGTNLSPSGISALALPSVGLLNTQFP